MSYKIISKFVKDISFELPNVEAYVLLEKEISKYNLNFDIKSKPFKKNIIEINTILKNLSLKVGSYADQLSRSTDNLASLDLLNAIGKFAKEINATNLINSDPKKWILNTPNELKLINASHPLLTGEVVSNTIKVGGNYKALLITGPNTGGKTVALKTAGLLTVMALSGLPIPAQNGTKIPAYTEVFADIGDEQSIEQSLSTFSGHIKSIINIISKANNTSLVFQIQPC